MQRTNALAVAGVVLVVALVVIPVVESSSASTSAHSSAHGYTVARKTRLQGIVSEHFMHAYRSYMQHAFPQDELKPLSCTGTNHFGGYSLTLIDSLDTLAMLGYREEFWDKVQFVVEHVHFNASMHVSVFETTIRVVGGLLSAHALAVQMRDEALAHQSPSPGLSSSSKSATTASTSGSSIGVWMDAAVAYRDGLVHRAKDIADRMVSAFDTPTGIPFNEVHLCSGVDRNKGHTTCPAAAGTLLLEFGTLSVLTGDCTYWTVAKRALDGIWKHRGKNNLVGTMIDILSGIWTHSEAHIGASIDSFYEYLLKAHVMFGSGSEFFSMWTAAHRAIHKYTYHEGWFLSSTVDAARGGVLGEINDYKFNSLQAFWPGLLVLAGDVPGALDAYRKLHCVVRDWGMLPEYVHLGTYIRRQSPQRIGPGYPLRPEFIESTLLLYEATGDDHFLAVAERFLQQIASTKQRCGYAAVLDVHHRTFEDKMDSFLLAETFKYLYLIFQPTPKEIFMERERWYHVHGRRSRLPIELRFHDELSNAVALRSAFVFTTEAHPLPVTTATLAIGAKCASHGDMFFLSHNDIRRLHHDFSAHPKRDYENLCQPTRDGGGEDVRGYLDDCDSRNNDTPRSEFGAAEPRRRSVWRKNAASPREQCPVIDYMRDIAPYVAETFYRSSVAAGREGVDRCYEYIQARTLGHPEKVLQRVTAHSVHHAAQQQLLHGHRSLHDANAHQHEQLHARVEELPITVLRDKTLTWSCDLGIVLTITVMSDTPAVATANFHRQGVTEIVSPQVSVDALFMPNHEVILVVPPVGIHIQTTNDVFLAHRGSSLGDQQQTLDPQTVAPMPRFMTSGAEFNPPICDRTAAFDGRTEILLLQNAPLLEVKDLGCPPVGGDAASTSGKSSGTAAATMGWWWAKKRPPPFRPSRGHPHDAVASEPADPVPFGVLIRRGACPFKAKVAYAERLGAAFVLIANHDDSLVLMADAAPDGTKPFTLVPTSIPAYMVAEATVAHLRIDPNDDSEEWSAHVAEETEDMRAMRATASWANSEARFRSVSLLCTLSAKAQFRALGFEVRHAAAESTAGSGNSSPDALLLYPERLAPIATELRDERMLLARYLATGDIAPLVLSSDAATVMRDDASYCRVGEQTYKGVAPSLEIFAPHSRNVHTTRPTATVSPLQFNEVRFRLSIPLRSAAAADGQRGMLEVVVVTNISLARDFRAGATTSADGAPVHLGTLPDSVAVESATNSMWSAGVHDGRSDSDNKISRSGDETDGRRHTSSSSNIVWISSRFLRAMRQSCPPEVGVQHRDSNEPATFSEQAAALLHRRRQSPLHATASFVTEECHSNDLVNCRTEALICSEYCGSCGELEGPSLRFVVEHESFFLKRRAAQQHQQQEEQQHHSRLSGSSTTTRQLLHPLQQRFEWRTREFVQHLVDIDTRSGRSGASGVLALFQQRHSNGRYEELTLFDSIEARNALREQEDAEHIGWEQRAFSRERILEEVRRLFVDPSTWSSSVDTSSS